MYTIDTCPSCQSKKSQEGWAIVAPFLAHYAVERPPFLCKLLECSICSFRFFDAPLTPEKVARLYSGYRGERYFTERLRREFWYSRQFNDGIGGWAQNVPLPVRAPAQLFPP